MRIKKTSRGFEYIEFDDYNGKKSSLQQSSLALYETPGTGAIWLGTDESRMHLDRKLVKKLIYRLSTWLETGSFSVKKGEPLK